MATTSSHSRRAAVLAATATLWSLPAAADCTCRALGQDFELGRSVCLSTPKGARLATCDMVLNNTSWRMSDVPCVVEAARVSGLAAEPPARRTIAAHH